MTRNNFMVFSGHRESLYFQLFFIGTGEKMFEEIENKMKELRAIVADTIKNFLRTQLEFGKTYEGPICPYREEKGGCYLSLKPCVDTLSHPPINKTEKQYWIKCPVYNEAWLKVSR